MLKPELPISSEYLSAATLHPWVTARLIKDVSSDGGRYVIPAGTVVQVRGARLDDGSIRIKHGDIILEGTHKDLRL